MSAKSMDLTNRSILIVDDHPLLREGLHRTLADAGVSTIREATDGMEALHILETFRPDIILMDLYMPGMSGIEATAQIIKQYPTAKIIILSVCEDDTAIADALMAGAQGFLNKSMRSHEIIHSLSQLLAGKVPLAKPISQAVLGRLTDTAATQVFEPTVRYSGPAQTISLTMREIEVLSAMAEGLSNREISQNFYISENTVKNHVRNILGKLDVNSRTRAIAKAVEEGLIRQKTPQPNQRALRQRR